MKTQKLVLKTDEENLRVRIELERYIQEVAKSLHEEVVILETQIERTSLAEQYEKEGNASKAIYLYKKNVDDGCTDPNVYLHLANLYKKSNQVTLEIQTLEKAQEIFETMCANQNHSFFDELSRLKAAIEKTHMIGEALMESDRGLYCEQLSVFRKRLDHAYQKNEKTVR